MAVENLVHGHPDEIDRDTVRGVTALEIVAQKVAPAGSVLVSVQDSKVRRKTALSPVDPGGLDIVRNASRAFGKRREIPGMNRTGAVDAL